MVANMPRPPSAPFLSENNWSCAVPWSPNFLMHQSVSVSLELKPDQTGSFKERKPISPTLDLELFFDPSRVKGNVLFDSYLFQFSHWATKLDIPSVALMQIVILEEYWSQLLHSPEVELLEHQMEHWNHSLGCTGFGYSPSSPSWPSFVKRKMIFLLSGSSIRFHSMIRNKFSFQFSKLERCWALTW